VTSEEGHPCQIRKGWGTLKYGVVGLTKSTAGMAVHQEKEYQGVGQAPPYRGEGAAWRYLEDSWGIRLALGG